VTPVGVVCGGPSLEHEISLKSGHEVLEHIDRDRFDATPVIIGKRSQWTVGGDEVGDALAGAHAMREVGIDCCFLALHGPYGEDGRVQAFLETCGFRYTGSTPGAMAVSGDKILAKRVVATLGVPLADDRLVPPTRVDEIESTLGYPCVVKDPHQGSTLGMEIVSERQELNSAARGCCRSPRFARRTATLISRRSTPRPQAPKRSARPTSRASRRSGCARRR
jgi:D-alanine-D-alanine ligase